MLNPIDLKVYDWNDVERAICSIMGIDQKHFRDYHEVVGGSYKDLWHSWVDMSCGEVINGTASIFWFSFADGDPKHEWELPFYQAIQELGRRLEQESIMIRYSW